MLGAFLTGALAALLVGLAASGGGFSLGFGQALGEAASSAAGRVLMAGSGMALLVADAVLLLRAFGLGAGKTIEFESGAGKMVVDVSALEECLRRTALDDPEVTDATASIRIPRAGSSRAIVCDLDVGLIERADIPGKGGDVAARVRRRFLQIIPMETDPVVNLRIRIRPPRPGPDSAPTVSMAAAQPSTTSQEPAKLPDVPEFTGERRYAVQEDGDGAT